MKKTKRAKNSNNATLETSVGVTVIQANFYETFSYTRLLHSTGYGSKDPVRALALIRTLTLKQHHHQKTVMHVQLSKYKFTVQCIHVP